MIALCIELLPGNKTTIFINSKIIGIITPCSSKIPDVSAEHIAFIFRDEEKDGGNMLFQNLTTLLPRREYSSYSPL
jgi:hypothetical protein